MLTIFIIIIFIVIMIASSIPISKILSHKRLEYKLKKNPPEMVAFQVKLPHDSEKTNEHMMRFWNRIHSQLPLDKKMMQENKNVLRAGIFGYGAVDGQAPRVKFIIWCIPELSEKVQLTLNECYGAEAQITDLKAKDDVLGKYLTASKEFEDYQNQLKNLEKANQEAQEAQENQIDDDDDDWRARK